MESTATPMQQAFWCIFYASGIIGTLLVYGILQERIMQHPYDNEIFTYSVFLVFMNRIAAVIFSIAMARVSAESMAPKAPLWKYLIISFCNVYASTCQYEALKYVSFAVQMLGKSFKMLPVMLWGMVINRKSYSLSDWCIGAAVTLGVTEFLMTGPTSSSHGGGHEGSSAKGLLFLLAFLALDGLTSTMQEKLFKEHKTSKYNQMLYVNCFSSCVSLVTLAVSGTLLPAFKFCFSHGAFMADATALSAAAVGGQFFIYSQVKEFGALVFAATMNVRQVISIIVSYMTYHHSITMPQVWGLVIVFGALFYKSSRSLTNSQADEEEKKLLQEKQGEQDARVATDYAAAGPAGKV